MRDEFTVISYILNSNDASFISKNNITEDCFDQYKDEFNFVNDYVNKYNSIPSVFTFLSKFTYLEAVPEVNDSPEYIVDLVEHNRQLINYMHYRKDSDNIAKTSESIGDIRIKTEEFLKSLDKSTAIKSVDILSDFTRFDEYVDKCNNFNNHYVTTGFKELDDVIGGWDRNEEYATIIARSNSGKTWILLKSAIAAAKSGLTVGLYSGEMSESKVGYRIDSLLGGISNGALVHGNTMIGAEYKQYIEDVKNDSSLGKILVLTPTMVGGPVGVHALQSFIERENLDILCIDQHSLLEDDRKARNPVERASNISRDIKNLQVMKKIPIITVSQQNRGNTEETGGATLANVSQSDRIGQDSTIVIALENKDGVMTLSIIKSRDSVVGGKLTYAIDLDKGIFRFMPSTDDASGGKGVDDLRQEYDEEEEYF